MRFFPFFDFFRLLDPPGCTGWNFSPEKKPRGMLKTCLNTFGNVFGHFEKMKVFQFFEVFPSLDLPGCTGQFFLRKLPQNKFETCLDTSKKVLDTFEKSNFFRFFYEFLQNSISRLHWARKLRKKLPQASLDTFGKVFWDFGTLKSFRFLWIFFESPVCTGHSVFRRKTQSKHSQTMFLGTFSDNFESFEVFVFFKVFSKLRPSKVHWRLFLKQNYLKTGSKHVWTILGTVLDTLEILNFSIFSNLSLTRPSRVHCAKFLPKKLPRHMFKTCLIAFGNVFWAFWKIEGFSSFLEFFQVSTLQGALGNFFRKNHLKTSSKLVWTLLGKFLDTFEFSNFFRFFFFEFFQVSTLEGALVNLFLPKKLPQSLFKTCLNYLGNVFGHFGKKWKFFHFSDVFPCFDPPGCTGQYFSPEKYLKTSSTLVWKLLRTFLDTFRNSIFFDFFFDFLQVLISKVHWSRKFRKKSAQNKFGHFWKCSSGFWKYEIFSVFLNFFDFSTLQGALGETFHRKKTSRHVENMFEHFWERIWAFWKNRKFSSFLKFFPVWTFQGALGSFFWENYLKTSSKLVWTLLRTFWTLLRNQFFFVFSSNFHKIRSPGCTGQEKFGKNYLKQVWTLLERFFGILELWKLFEFCGFFLSFLCALGTAFSVEKLNQNILKQCFWEHFRTILKFSKFFLFLKLFPSLDPPRCTGDFFSKQNYLKTDSEHVWTLLGTVLDTLETMKFSIFSNLSLTRPSRVHCAKILPRKITSKHVQNMFDCFWEGFLGILKNWKFSQFFGVFPSFDSPRCTGKFVLEKITSKQVQNLFGHF